MSRSKEGRQDIDPNAASQSATDPTQAQTDTGAFNERVGARGQTDYTGGRESYREFPRRSTSFRDRDETDTGRSSYTPYRGSSPTPYESRYNRGGYSGRGESRASYRGREIGSYGYRGEQSGRGDIYSRGGAISRYQGREDYDTNDRYGSYNRTADYEPESYRRDYRSRHESGGRHEGEGRYGSRSYGHILGQQDYGSARSRGERQYDYDRDSRLYGRDRDEHNEMYNRESFGGRSGAYDRDYDQSYAALRSGFDRDEEDYGYENRGYWGSERTGRNYLRCRDIMTKDVTTCSPQTSLKEVADRMEDDNVGSIPVVENGRLVGIVTDRDIVCRVLAEGREVRTATAADAMSEELITCNPDETVYDAIQKMGEHQIRRIPIVDMNGRLRGIIAMADIALEAERDRELANALEQISNPTPNRSRRV